MGTMFLASNSRSSSMPGEALSLRDVITFRRVTCEAGH
jgi:hypothetical protein